MTVEEFKNIVIEDGIAEVTREYADEAVKREGALDGFEIARSLTTREQFEFVLQERERHEAELRRANMLGENDLDEYWFERWATLQVEWVYQVLMAAAWARAGDPVNARAALKAEEVVRSLQGAA